MNFGLQSGQITEHPGQWSKDKPIFGCVNRKEQEDFYIYIHLYMALI